MGWQERKRSSWSAVLSKARTAFPFPDDRSEDPVGFLGDWALGSTILEETWGSSTGGAQRHSVSQAQHFTDTAKGRQYFPPTSDLFLSDTAAFFSMKVCQTQQSQRGDSLRKPCSALPGVTPSYPNCLVGLSCPVVALGCLTVFCRISEVGWGFMCLPSSDF